MTDTCQKKLAAFQHHYSWLQMPHSQGERGEIHRAFRLIGSFMSDGEQAGTPPLTASEEPTDTTTLHRRPTGQIRLCPKINPCHE